MKESRITQFIDAVAVTFVTLGGIFVVSSCYSELAKTDQLHHIALHFENRLLRMDDRINELEKDIKSIKKKLNIEDEDE
jgi:hypothetical protein